MVTHPSTNQAQRRLTSLIEIDALTTMPNPQPMLNSIWGEWHWQCSLQATEGLLLGQKQAVAEVSTRMLTL